MAEAGVLLTMTIPGARATAPGEAQAWEAVDLEEGEWEEWEGWVTWVTWEGWEWVEEGEEGGQAPGAVEEEEEP